MSLNWHQLPFDINSQSIHQPFQNHHHSSLPLSASLDQPSIDHHLLSSATYDYQLASSLFPDQNKTQNQNQNQIQSQSQSHNPNHHSSHSPSSSIDSNLSELHSSFNNSIPFDYHHHFHNHQQHPEPSPPSHDQQHFLTHSSIDLINHSPPNPSYLSIPQTQNHPLNQSVSLAQPSGPATTTSQSLSSLQIELSPGSPAPIQNQSWCPAGRVSRSGSVSSESVSSSMLAPPPPPPNGSLTLASDWLVWECEAGWGMRWVEGEAEAGRRRSRSEGDIGDARAMSAEERCFQPTFEAPAPGSVPARRKARSLVERWDAPRLGGLGTPEIKVNDQSVFRPATAPQGAFLATFELPAPALELDDERGTRGVDIPEPERACAKRVLDGHSYTDCFGSLVDGSCHGLHAPIQNAGCSIVEGGLVGNPGSGGRIHESQQHQQRKNNKRTGNNGGRYRRLAPANRVCGYCGAKFTRNDRLNYHIDSIHEYKEPKFKCTRLDCARAFRQRSDLVRHIKHVHHD